MNVNVTWFEIGRCILRLPSYIEKFLQEYEQSLLKNVCECTRMFCARYVASESNVNCTLVVNWFLRSRHKESQVPEYKSFG